MRGGGLVLVLRSVGLPVDEHNEYPAESSYTQDKHKAQYISLKEICESNTDDSQAQIDGFYLCRMRLKIP